MRYAILSDIHSNKQALTSVFIDIKNNGIDQVLSLGDLIGYGPSPVEILDLSFSKIHKFVLGNHDALLCDKMNSKNFSKEALKVLNFTKNKIGHNAIKFFDLQPYILNEKGFACAHANFFAPEKFEYTIHEDIADKSFAESAHKLYFIGHSHIPAIFVKRGEQGDVHYIKSRDFTLEQEKRYIVNVGSVGHPRDNDTRASYCIYDSDKQQIFFRKVPFDIDGYVKDLIAQKIPQSTAYFLSAKTNATDINLREIVDFKPLGNKKIKTELIHSNIRRKIKKEKNTKDKLFYCFIVICLFYIAFLRKEDIKLLFKPTVNLSASNTKSIISSSFKFDESIIQMPKKRGRLTKNNVWDNWNVKMHKKHKVYLKYQEDNLPYIQIKSESIKNFQIEYIPVIFYQGDKLSASIQFKNIDFKQGNFEFKLEYEDKDGVRKILSKREPENFTKNHRWTRYSISLKEVERITDLTKVFFVIKGNFLGIINIRKCNLVKQ